MYREMITAVSSVNLEFCRVPQMQTQNEPASLNTEPGGQKTLVDMCYGRGGTGGRVGSEKASQGSHV